MSYSKILAILIVFSVFAFASCTSSSPQNVEVKQASKTVETVTNAKGGWEEEWAKAQTAARVEGKLVVYTNYSPVIRNALSKPFQEKFGVNIEFATGAGVEFIQKLKMERKAGLYTTDLWIGGINSLFLYLRPEGGLDPLRPLLILPEVIDPKIWWKTEGKENELPFADKTGTDAFYFMASPQTSIVINTTLVKPEELKSYYDLLNPKFTGKITMRDPTIPGSGLQWFGAVSTELVGMDFVRKLAEQKPVISRDQRLQFEWLSQGKYLVGLALGADDMYNEFKKAGAPLAALTPKEGTHLSAGNGFIALINKAPHPRAAQVFTNWLLTREGGVIMSNVEGRQSARLDVPSDHIWEGSVRKPGVKYYVTMTEESTLKADEHLTVAREVFGPLMR